MEISPLLLEIPTATDFGYLSQPEDHKVGLAERVCVAPAGSADWDIIKFNQAGLHDQF